MSGADASPRHPMPEQKSWEQAVAEVLADPAQQRLARDCYFDGTALEAADRYWQSDEWRAVRQLLPTGRGRVLDLGAGRGIASYALAREGWKVDAVEPDPSKIVGAEAIRNVAASTSLPITVWENFGEQLPFPMATFDLVIARQALHHARDLQGLIRELHRVTRPGGLLIAWREHVISRAEDLERFFEVHPLHRFYGGERAYLLSEYQQAFTGAGFTVRRTIGPLESPINYAPLTRQGLADELAGRLPSFLGVRGAARQLLKAEGILSVSLRLVGLVDNRPGRLFSFVAARDK